MSNTINLNKALTKALAGVRVKRWVDFSKETQTALIKAVKPTQKDGKVIEVQPPCASLGVINKGTKRDGLIQLGLKGALWEDFKEFASVGFWKGAYSDPAGGYGYVIEEIPVKGGKAKKYCYYILPDGVKGTLYREKTVKAKKAEESKETVNKAKSKEKVNKAVKVLEAQLDEAGAKKYAMVKN